MLVLRLALRALAWRSAASLTIFAIALIGIGAAAVGPIYLRAVDERVLTERLIQAPANQRDLHLTQQTIPSSYVLARHGDIHKLAAEATDPRWFDPPVYSEDAQVSYTHDRVHYLGELAAVDGLCAHLKIVSGKCLAPGAKDETLISALAARTAHIGVGDTIQAVSGGESHPIRLRIVGVVTKRPASGTFWNTWHYFNAFPPPTDSAPGRLDSFFVTHQTLAVRADAVTQTLSAQLRLRPAAVHVADVGPLRAHLQEVVAAAAKLPPPNPEVGSQLPQVVDAMQKEMSLSRSLIILPTVQLVLLAILVLYAVVAGSAAVKGPELALARLRGRRPRSVLMQGLAEPVVLVLLAAPAATALAWLVVRLFADRLLGRNVEVLFPLSAVAAAGAAALGAIGAAAVAARRITGSPVGALLRRGTERTGSSVGLAIADAAAVVLALAGLVELLAGGVLQSGDTDPLSALAPTLLAIAAAIVALRLLPAAGAVFVRWTRDSRRLAAFLAVRQIVRRPASARSLLLIAVALALATFAVANWSVAGTNRDVRALNQTGAETVLSVQPSDKVYDLRTAVDRADPSGHAMAAALVDVGNSTPLLAVDTARFTGVATWRSNYSATSLPTLLQTLVPRQSPPPLAFSGQALRLSVDLVEAPSTRVNLTVYVTGADHLQTGYDLGAVQPGQNSYTARLAPVCGTRCRITGISMLPSVAGNRVVGTQSPVRTRANLTADVLKDGQWRTVPGFDRAASWRNGGEGTVRLQDGLSVSLAQQSLSAPSPRLEAAHAPSHLPAVLASGTASTYPGSTASSVELFGLDGRPQLLNGVLESTTLPQVDRYGAMIDFGLALESMTNIPGRSTQFQVWVAPGAPADLVARLARQGVKVTGVRHASTYRDGLDHSGPAYADGLFLVAAGAAALLSVGAALLSGGITARRRGYEFAALAAVGVPSRTLRRATAAEQGVLIGVGVVVGVAAGIGGSALALPSTPFFVNEDIGPPAQHALPWGLLGLLVAAVAVVFLVTSLFVGRLVARQADPIRLREAQQ